MHYRTCPNCGSTNIIKNNYKDAQTFHCRDGKAYGTSDQQRSHDQKTRRQALDAYVERVSIPGVKRSFGVSHYTLARWLVMMFEKLPSLAERLVKWQPGDVLELDAFMVVRPAKEPKTLDLDCFVPSNSSGRRFRDWRSKRTHLPQALGSTPASLQTW